MNIFWTVFNVALIILIITAIVIVVKQIQKLI